VPLKVLLRTVLGNLVVITTTRLEKLHCDDSQPTHDQHHSHVNPMLLRHLLTDCLIFFLTGVNNYSGALE
jgi:hypothetical protein